MGVKNNARWLGVAAIGKAAPQFLAVAMYARLLAPEQLGLAALAAVVVNLSNTLKEMGATASVVRAADEPSTDLLSTLFWLSCFIGSLILLLLFALGSQIEVIMRADGLKELLRWFAVSIFLNALCPVFVGLLERRGEFRQLARIEIVSSATGLIAAAALLAYEPGVYIVAVQAVVASACTLVQLALHVGWVPSLRITRSELPGVFRFNGGVSAFNFVNFVSRNFDSAYTGRVLGVQAVGYYSHAYKMMMLPLQFTTFLASRAILPRLSVAQAEASDASPIFLRALAAVFSFALPLMCLLFLLRNEAVLIVLGPGWEASSRLLVYLAPVGAVQSLLSLTGAVFLSSGKGLLLFWLGIVGASLHVVGILVGAAWGIEGVAAGYLVANLLNAVPCFWVTFKVLKSSPLLVFTHLAPIALAGSGALAVGLASTFLLTTYEAHALVTMTITSAMFAGVYALVLFHLARPVWNDWLDFMGRR